MMKNMSKVFLASAVVFGSVGSANALEAGDTLVRLGSSTEVPHEHTSIVGLSPYDISLERVGGGIASMSYMFTPNIGMGILLTTPFKHAVSGHSGLVHANLGSFNVVYLGVTAQYHYELGNFKPYAGIGATYAKFYGASIDHTTLPNERMSIDDAVAGTIEAGIDYKLAEETYVNVSAVYLDLETDMYIRGGINPNINMKLDPVLWNFSLVHKF